MKIKRLLKIAVRVIFGVPVALILIVMASYYAYFYYLDGANGSIVSLDMEREYLLYVPESYDPDAPTPLVISLHAAMQWPATQRAISQWDRLADTHGFLVVYPAGRSQWNSGTGIGARIWTMKAGVREMRDIRYISDLIDRLQATYNVDADRIYADGISNGGGMAYALACTLSDRIAAVGTVAAAQGLPSNWCEAERPVPVISFHGTDDPWVPYGGAPPNWLSPVAFPDTAKFVQAWATRNGCGTDPTEAAIADDVTRVEYTNCTDGADVVHYRVEGGGHTWPSGRKLPEWYAGVTTTSIDATKLMWKFYQSHPLRAD